ncbi:hypothetical protein PINS_up008220 [Pythium insidiosum]|nr:hypothetical protein PINS_up008220 [Pythium insidiosum]
MTSCCTRTDRSQLQKETHWRSSCGAAALGEPLAYVLGFKEFWSMSFRVSADTLIPRSDSEVLIETLVSLYPSMTALRVLDLGTGSGCLLLAALSEFPNATGVGIDISAGALDIARDNAQRLGFSHRSTFLEMDMETLPSANDVVFAQGFDVILCNPPYIPLQELALIAPDVLAHEPHGALFADGPDALKSATASSSGDLGLRFYESLERSARALLRAEVASRGSAILMEIGSRQQAAAVRDLFVRGRILVRSLSLGRRGATSRRALLAAMTSRAITILLYKLLV